MLTDEQNKQFGRLETRLHQLLNHHASLEELELFQEYTAHLSTLQQQSIQTVEFLERYVFEPFEGLAQALRWREAAHELLQSIQGGTSNG